MSTQNLDPLPLRAARELESAAREALSVNDGLQDDKGIDLVEARIAALRAAQALVAQHSAPSAPPLVATLRPDDIFATGGVLRGVAVAQSERMP